MGSCADACTASLTCARECKTMQHRQSFETSHVHSTRTTLSNARWKRVLQVNRQLMWIWTCHWAALGACTHHGAHPSDCVPCVAWTKQSGRRCHPPIPVRSIPRRERGAWHTLCRHSPAWTRMPLCCRSSGVEGSPVGRIPKSHSTTQLHQVSMAMTRTNCTTFHVSDLQNFRQTPPHIPCHVRRRTLQ